MQAVYQLPFISFLYCALAHRHLSKLIAGPPTVWRALSMCWLHHHFWLNVISRGCQKDWRRLTIASAPHDGVSADSRVSPICVLHSLCLMTRMRDIISTEWSKLESFHMRCRWRSSDLVYIPRVRTWSFVPVCHHDSRIGYMYVSAIWHYMYTCHCCSLDARLCTCRRSLSFRFGSETYLRQRLAVNCTNATFILTWQEKLQVFQHLGFRAYFKLHHTWL